MKRLYFIITILTSLTYCGTGTTDADYDHWNKKLSVVFSSPGISPETAVDAKIQEKIAAMIDSARDTVEMCVYELAVPEIYEAMIRAHRRGVNVRFVGDIDCLNTYEGYQAFLEEGIPMSLVNPLKIMHNKFVIVDNYFVTMGSANYTSTGFWKNNENVLFIQDRDVALYFKKEFNIMFHLGVYGNVKSAAYFTNNAQLNLGYYPEFIDYKRPDYDAFGGLNYNNLVDANFTHNLFYVGPAKVEILFTPYLDGLATKPGVIDEDGYEISANDRIISALKTAQHKIQFAMFAFTSETIRNAILNHANSTPGLVVEGIFDKSWHSGIRDDYVWGNENAVHHSFIDEGHDVRYDGNNNVDPDNPLHGGKCHNKFALIDPGTANAKVITGSFNFSSAAATKGNDETCLIIEDQEITKLYNQNFQTMFANSHHPTRDVKGDRASLREVIFNEINWAGSRSNGGINYDSDKFIELKNTTNRRINISGWQIVGVARYNWRITSYIVPRNTYIEPQGHFVLYTYSSNSAFSYSDNVQDYQYLYLHGQQEQAHEKNQYFISLTLKDTNQTTIDKAGYNGFKWPVKRWATNYDTVDTANGSPITNWGGAQGAIYQSMYRSDISADGTLTSSWSTTGAPNGYVKTGYRNNTYATPGTD